MIAWEEIDVLSAPIIGLYNEMHMRIIKNIAKRYAALFEAYSTIVIKASGDKWKQYRLPPSVEWQVRKLIEAGGVFDDITAEVAKTMNISERLLAAIFQDAGLMTIAFDRDLFKKAGMKELPLNLSPSAVQILRATLQKTQGIVNNLCRTTASTGQLEFIHACDIAYMQAVSGAITPEEAIKEQLKILAAQGVHVVHYSGKRDQIDVALRRAVMTGISQTAAQIQLQYCKENGIKTVRVSAHLGARNKGTYPANHEWWQGRLYDISGNPNALYLDFYKYTGFGTGEGLHGWNCRHSFYPHVIGADTSLIEKQRYLADYQNAKLTYTDPYTGKQVTTSYYDATQMQRKLERDIRDKKRIAAALGEAGINNWQERQDIKAVQAQLREFLKETGLQRQGNREWIAQTVQSIGKKPLPPPPPPPAPTAPALWSIKPSRKELIAEGGMENLVNTGYVSKGGAVANQGHTDSEKVQFPNGQAAIAKRFHTAVQEELAYKINEMFGLDMVPESWYSKKEKRSFQLWVDNAKIGSSISIGDITSVQAAKAFFFDSLIANGDRHGANFLFTKDKRLVLIDNEWAFWDRFDVVDEMYFHSADIADGVIGGLKRVNKPRARFEPVPIDPFLRDMLRDALDSGKLEKLARQYLTAPQLLALLSRAEDLYQNWYIWFEDL